MLLYPDSWHSSLAGCWCRSAPSAALAFALVGLPDHLPLLVQTTLVVRSADNKILHHRDVWANIPSIPWPVRGQLGYWSSWAMTRLLGW